MKELAQEAHIVENLYVELKSVDSKFLAKMSDIHDSKKSDLIVATFDNFRIIHTQKEGTGRSIISY